MLRFDQTEFDKGCRAIEIAARNGNHEEALAALRRLLEKLEHKEEPVSRGSHIAEIEQFGVEIREINMLERSGVCTVGEFVKLEHKQFLEVYQFAKKTTTNLQQAQELARKSIINRARRLRRARRKMGPRPQ